MLLKFKRNYFDIFLDKIIASSDFVILNNKYYAIIIYKMPKMGGQQLKLLALWPLTEDLTSF